MNKIFIKTFLSIAVLMTLANCAVRSENNLITINHQVSSIDNASRRDNLIITQKIESENLIANNNLGDLEILTHQQINQYRQSRNLPALQFSDRISEQARIHSQNMAQGQTPFSHNGFGDRIATISSTINYSSAAENVAYNQGYANPVKNAVDGWLKSPGHYKNIVGDYNLTGIGIATNSQGEYYFTQIFVLSNN